MGLEALPKIPIIDFSKENLKPGTDSWFPACNNVRHALEEHGCFMAVYDQVPLEVCNTVVGAMRELFDLPIETKKKNIINKPYHGYNQEDPAAPRHEGMGIDNVTTLEEIRNFAKVMWPAGNEHFCQSLHCYSKLLAELEQTVMRMVLESYGIENSSHIGSATFLIRFLKYGAPKMNETSMTLPPHTDKSFMSILHQNQVNGLEIETKDGKWIRYEPPSLPVFLVMAGEAFRAWSNDRIHPPKHRVNVEGNEARYSLGLFSFTNGMIKIPEELVDDQHPLKFKSFDHIGLVHFLGTEEGRKFESALTTYCGL